MPVQKRAGEDVPTQPDHKRARVPPSSSQPTTVLERAAARVAAVNQAMGSNFDLRQSSVKPPAHSPLLSLESGLRKPLTPTELLARSKEEVRLRSMSASASASPVQPPASLQAAVHPPVHPPVPQKHLAQQSPVPPHANAMSRPNSIPPSPAQSNSSVPSSLRDLKPIERRSDGQLYSTFVGKLYASSCRV
jgi:hypothetical protein